MSADVIRKTAELAVSSERTATADVCFPGGPPDRDFDAYAPNWAAPAKVVGGRAHDLVTGGDAPPAFVADIRNRGNRYEASIKFLPTPRGQAEYETLKALAAEGVVQPVSMAFTDVKTGPIPDHLKAQGARRYITSGRLIELSLVTIGAVPSAQITSIKHVSPVASPFDEHRARVAEIAKRCAPPTVTRAVTAADLERLDYQRARFICDTATVTDHQQKVARAWADAVSHQLGIPPVIIEWSMTSAKAAGEFRRGEPHKIFINPSLPVAELPAVVCHEQAHRARHLWRWPQDEWRVERDTADLLELLGA